MKEKYIVEIPVNLIKKEDNWFFTSAPVEKKEVILAYLKNNGTISYYGSNYLIDRMTGERIALDLNEYTDGEYSWHTDEIYHFEHYNLKLNDDFIEYVLAKTHGEKSRK